MEQELGLRIREMREQAGLLASDLAERVGLDPTALSKIENGRRGVKSVELARIAKALGVSPLALLEPQSLAGRLPIAARAAGASITMGRAYDRLLSLTELHGVLAQNSIYSSPTLSAVPSVVGMNWLEAAETLATWAQRELPLEGVDGDERFSELVEQVESKLGVDVLIEPYPEDPLSGAAIMDAAFPLIFVNSAHPLPRSLFTLAHELGHVLARHRGAGITLDRELSGSTDDERTANAFAASFLMPKAIVDQTIADKGRTSATMIALAFRFGVSFESLIYRLHNLGIIDANGRDQLKAVNWRQLVLHLPDQDLRGDLKFVDAGRFQTRSLTSPQTTHPALLVARATTAFRKGVISANALANLVGEAAEGILDNYQDGHDLGSDLKRIDADYAPKHDEAEEDRFAGTPF